MVSRVDLHGNFKALDYLKQFQRALQIVDELNIKIILDFDEGNCFIPENVIENLQEQADGKAEVTAHFLPVSN